MWQVFRDDGAYLVRFPYLVDLKYIWVVKVSQYVNLIDEDLKLLQSIFENGFDRIKASILKVFYSINCTKSSSSDPVFEFIALPYISFNGLYEPLALDQQFYLGGSSLLGA